MSLIALEKYDESCSEEETGPLQSSYSLTESYLLN